MTRADLQITRIVLFLSVCSGLLVLAAVSAPAEPASALTDAAAQVHVKQLCFECHRQGKSRGDIRLDLPVDQIDEAHWHRIVQVLHHADMPPESARQPSKEVRQQLEAWAQGHLNRHILKRAGDPGAVAWRRLTVIELDNMIRDLTGQPIPASRHFPTENFGGEGFSNVGNVQSALSGPLLDKYLAMAEEVARHARFDKRGKLAFDPPGAIQAPEVRQDQTLYDIKLMGRTVCGELYVGPGQRIGGQEDERSLDDGFKNAAIAWEGPGDYFVCLWLAQAAKNPQAALDGIAETQQLNPVYLKYLRTLQETCPRDSLEHALWVGPLSRLPAATAVDQPVPDDIRTACQEIGASVWSCMRRATVNGLKFLPGNPNVITCPKWIDLKPEAKKASTPSQPQGGRPSAKKPAPAAGSGQLVIVIEHVPPLQEGTIVYCGLPTLQLKGKDAQKGDLKAVVLTKDSLKALPDGASYAEHSFAGSAREPFLMLTKSCKLIFDISKHTRDLLDGAPVEAMVPMDRGAKGGRVFVRSTTDPDSAARGPDADVLWLVAGKEESSLQEEWRALFKRWCPPHPITIAPFDSRKNFGLPDEVQFLRDDRRMQQQLLDEAGRKRMDDLWAYLYLMSNEPRLRLDVFGGKQQIAGRDADA